MVNFRESAQKGARSGHQNSSQWCSKIAPRDLAQKGVHFGHQTSRWCPKMAPYIWGAKNKIHLIDISKTACQLEKAAEFLASIAAQGKMILWVGTKKAAQDVIANAAISLNMPFVTRRWVGGTLSNYAQVKKSVTKHMHLQDVIANTEAIANYTKKEVSLLQKSIDRLEKNVGGLRKLTWPVAAIVIVDVKKEQSAVLEACQMGVPVVGIVDTNSDPSMIDYVIPGNDDAPDSINIMISYLKDAVERAVIASKAVAGSDAVVEIEHEAAEALDTSDVLLLDLPTEEDQDEVADKKRKSVASNNVGSSKLPSGSKRTSDRK